MHYVSALPSYDLHNKRVILRADLNVPLNNGTITDDYRLQAILPTIDAILKKGGYITLLTHIGRPKNNEPLLSTKILLSWFAQKNYSISWAASIDEAEHLLNTSIHPILLVENLRFYPEEKKGDIIFAKKLSTFGDFYINDAFGALHRNDTSIALLPTLFDFHHKTIGLLVEKELKMLTQLLHEPQKPFVIVVGGGKVKDKIPVIENLLHHAQTIALCPALAATFLKAMGKEVGKSLVDETVIPLCTSIIEKAKKFHVSLVFPLDYLIAYDTMQGNIEIISAEKFPHNGIALSIGPRTIAYYATILQDAKKIFFNAAMGFWNIPESLLGTQALLRAIAQSPAFSVVGGGDSVAAAHQEGLSQTIDFLSTGGGATLTYLSGKELPGLQALYHQHINK